MKQKSRHKKLKLFVRECPRCRNDSVSETDSQLFDERETCIAFPEEFGTRLIDLIQRAEIVLAYDPSCDALSSKGLDCLKRIIVKAKEIAIHHAYVVKCDLGFRHREPPDADRKK